MLNKMYKQLVQQKEQQKAQQKCAIIMLHIR